MYRWRRLTPDMSQRIGPFLAGVGVVTAAYISGRVSVHGLSSMLSFPQGEVDNVSAPAGSHLEQG